MTQLTVAITVQSLDQALAAAARAVEHGADLVEFRIDAFTDQPAQVTQLVERSALPCIVTCRAVWEGGASELSGITIPDDYTVIIELSRPDATFLQVVAINFSFAVPRTVKRDWTFARAWLHGALKEETR